jgi:hypothetical protein
LGKGTAANYLTTFRDAVKTGKPVTEWNPAQKKKAKASADAAADDVSGVKGSKAFADLLRPAFNHDEGKTFLALCKKIEKAFENAEYETVYAGFLDFFAAAGDEIVG